MQPTFEILHDFSKRAGAAVPKDIHDDPFGVRNLRGGISGRAV
jgi:hypothetical protein